MRKPVITGPYREIAERLIAIRHFAGYSTGIDFAEAVDIAYKSWSHYERGLQQISLPNAKKLVQAYGLTLDFIYLGRSHTLPQNVAVGLLPKLELINSSASSDMPEDVAASLSSTNRSRESL